jgi:hypothetical protein
MTSLEESCTKVQINEHQLIEPQSDEQIDRHPIIEYKPFMLSKNDSCITDEVIAYTNALYEHLCQNQIVGLPLPTIPYFDSPRSYFDFINYSEHKFNLLNAYIYAFKRHLKKNNINDPNINYVNLQLITPLCRGCNCNSIDRRTCSICVSNYESYIIKLKPNIIKYIRNYPLLDILANYPDDNTSNYDLNIYITEFNQEFDTEIPTVL